MYGYAYKKWWCLVLGIFAGVKICSPYEATKSTPDPGPTTMEEKKGDSSGLIVRGGKSASTFLSMNRGVEEGQSGG